MFFIGRSAYVYRSASSKPKHLPQDHRCSSAKEWSAMPHHSAQRGNREAETQEREIWRTPAVKRTSPCADLFSLQRGFKYTEMGSRICASKAQMPPPSGGFQTNSNTKSQSPQPQHQRDNVSNISPHTASSCAVIRRQSHEATKSLLCSDVFNSPAFRLAARSAT